MAYWLIKSEPNKWSWDQHVAKGTDEWDGVRNFQARNNMIAMRPGDRAFYYHSREGLEVVGISEVVAEAHPDSTDDTGKWSCVDFRAVKPLTRPVPMPAIKADPELADMVLVKNSRLSVQPVTEAEWRRICSLGETDPD